MRNLWVYIINLVSEVILTIREDEKPAEEDNKSEEGNRRFI